MQHWAADHEALLDAKLAGLKAGLKLTPDQEKLWPPFEAAVRDAAKMRMEQMKAMMDRMQKMREWNDGADAKYGRHERHGSADQAISPVDRLEALGQAHVGAGRRNAERRRSRQAPLRQPRQLPEAAVRPARRRDADDGTWPHIAGWDMMGGMGMGMMGGEMGMMGREGMGMGMMGGGKGMMGQGGMGMMGREPGGMNMMGRQSDDEEDSSDDE